MLRNCLAAASLLLAACSQPGPSDAVARYGREAPSGPIIVKAAANGDARVEAGDTVFLRKGGVDYVVTADSQGSYAARKDDLLALLAEAERGQAASIDPRARPVYVVSPGGAETIAGVKGTLWKLHLRDVPALVTAEAVLADDPALANLGEALAMQSDFAIRRNSGLTGGPGSLEIAMIGLFEKGMVLRFDKALRLERIDRAPIAPSEFDVAGPLLDSVALRHRIEAERDRIATGLR